MSLHILDTADKIIESTDQHVGYLIRRFDEEVGFKPVKVAAWGLATASVLGAAAAGLAATAAGAGAYVALRAAQRARREHLAARHTAVASWGPALGEPEPGPGASVRREAASERLSGQVKPAADPAGPADPADPAGLDATSVAAGAG
jgi:hypothetical protein